MKPSLVDRIAPLAREQWQDYKLEFHYTSLHYYDVVITAEDNAFRVSFVKKPCEVPYVHLPDDTDKLFQPWWDDVKAWGVVEGGRLVAAVETSVEAWCNRLRVTEIWIDGPYRRQGLGTALMDVAVKRARDENRRAVVLETQSRNAGALAFYLAYGFTLIGFDACHYSNDDLARKEVRMEMGLFC